MPHVLLLTRTVRFSLNDRPPQGGPEGGPAPASNTFAAVPAPRGLARHYEFDVSCRAPADPATGYAVDIHDIDRAVRAVIVPMLENACRTSLNAEPEPLLLDAASGLAAALPVPLARLVWRLSPYYSVAWEDSLMSAVVIRQQFEFAAAHRLHVPALSDAENRRLFGKCNNPSGHGHNYRVQPEVVVDPAAERPFTLAELERITDETVIRRFDHKHLNVDTDDFRAVNPSVENIARVCHDLLAPAIAAASPAARLRAVTVWETDKTSATYPA